MGGWYRKDKLMKLLGQAEEALFQEGYHSESDAVEQAIVILINLPRGKMLVANAECVGCGFAHAPDYQDCVWLKNPY